MTTPMRLSLAITADASGVAPATAEARREIEAVSQSTTGLTGATGALSAANDEASRSSERLAQTLRGQGAAEKQLQANIRSMQGAARANTANIAAQFQDIAVTSAMGISPLQIALQQGTQLSAVLGPMGAAGAAKSLGAALLSVVNPTSLVTLGLVGATAAAIQYFSKSKAETRTIDQLLDAHKASIDELTAAWGKAADSSTQYGQRSSAAVSFGFEMTTGELRKRLREEVDAVNQAIADATSANLADIGGARAFRETELFKTLKVDIADLVEQAKNGEPDIIGLTRRIEELGQKSTNNGIRNLADDAANAVRPIEELARKLLEANRRLKELFNNVGPNGILLSQGTGAREDLGNLGAFEAAQAVAQSRARQSFDADVMGIYAKSPAEKAAAARAQAGASYNLDESASDRQLRIELAGTQALIEAEYELGQARLDRNRAIDLSVASQQLELQLIGKTSGEVERLQMEFDLTAQLREEAARAGIAVDQRDIDLIKAKAAEVGKLADEIARTSLAQDLMFEHDQLFRSPIEQRIAATQRAAGLDVDFTSYEADIIRTNAQLEINRDLTRDIAGGALTDLRSALDDGKLSFRELGDIAVNALDKIIDKIMNDLLDALAQLKGGGSGGGGIVSQIIGTLFGGANIFPAAPAGGGFESGIGLFDSGGTMLGGNVVPFGPKTRKLGRGVLADSGFGPRHFPAVLEEGEAVLTQEMTGRAMNVMRGQSAMAASQGGGTSTVRLIMPEGWRAEIVGEARQGAKGDTIEILQANNAARENLYQNGGRG